MKEKYIYVNSKVISKDSDEDKITVCDYQDNIEEIFTIENLIEELNQRETKLILKKKTNSESLRKSAIPTLLTYISFPTAIIVTLISIISQNFLLFGIGLFETGIITISGFLFEKHNKKVMRKEISGAELELQKISEEIERYNNLLLKLKNNKTKEQENIVPINKIIDIDYKHKLQKLRDYLNLYYKIGYNEEKFSKYYEQGTLGQNLRENFNEDEIKLVKTYFNNQSKKYNNIKTTI